MDPKIIQIQNVILMDHHESRESEYWIINHESLKCPTQISPHLKSDNLWFCKHLTSGVYFLLTLGVGKTKMTTPKVTKSSTLWQTHTTTHTKPFISLLSQAKTTHDVLPSWSRKLCSHDNGRKPPFSTQRFWVSSPIQQTIHLLFLNNRILPLDFFHIKSACSGAVV